MLRCISDSLTFSFSPCVLVFLPPHGECFFTVSVVLMKLTSLTRSNSSSTLIFAHFSLLAAPMESVLPHLIDQSDRQREREIADTYFDGFISLFSSTKSSGLDYEGKLHLSGICLALDNIFHWPVRWDPETERRQKKEENIKFAVRFRRTNLLGPWRTLILEMI